MPLYWRARQGIPQITYSLSLASLAIYKGTLFVCFLRVKLFYGIVRQNSNNSLYWTPSYGKFSNKLLGGFIGNGFKCLRNQVHMPFSFYRMRGRSGPVSESKFELKTLKVSNDTLNVSAPLIFQLHDKNHKNKTVFFLLDILLWRDHNFK